MKVLFCWSSISGYMASCWKELALRNGIEVFILAHRSKVHNSFADEILQGVPHQLVSPAEAADKYQIAEIVKSQSPNVIVITGWWLPEYRHLTRVKELQETPFVMGVDSPWRHIGQYGTRYRYRAYLKRLSHVFVTGERSWNYAKRLGFCESKISKGMYGVDVDLLSKVRHVRPTVPWPRRFLFLGRYVSVKGVDILVSAYAKYRSMSSDPWSLTCCGGGPMESILKAENAIENMGFVQPRELPTVLEQSGAFILPSRFDPWPLALVEAAASGLPIICSDACGSAVEIVKSFFNGLVVPTASVDELAHAMLWIEKHQDLMPIWGERSYQQASAYSAQLWADRWGDRLSRLVGK